MGWNPDSSALCLLPGSSAPVPKSHQDWLSHWRRFPCPAPSAVRGLYLHLGFELALAVRNSGSVSFTSTEKVPEKTSSREERDRYFTALGSVVHGPVLRPNIMVAGKCGGQSYLSRGGQDVKSKGGTGDWVEFSKTHLQ